jgi:hypothetical protein
MVSTSGGTQPRWRGDGKELFFLGPDRKVMAADIKEAAGTFEAGTPRSLFDSRILLILNASTSYDVTRDGQRFLMITPIEDTAPTPLTVVLNWTAGLKR